MGSQWDIGLTQSEQVVRVLVSQQFLRLGNLSLTSMGPRVTTKAASKPCPCSWDPSRCTHGPIACEFMLMHKQVVAVWVLGAGVYGHVRTQEPRQGQKPYRDTSFSPTIARGYRDCCSWVWLSLVPHKALSSLGDRPCRLAGDLLVADTVERHGT